MKLQAACVFIVHPVENLILAVTRRDGSGCGLPGGKAEPDELLQDTALRELFEETGLIAENPKLLWSRTDDSSYCETYTVTVTGGTIRDSAEGHVFWATLKDLIKDSPFGEYNEALFANLPLKAFSKYRMDC